ncbi:MAG: peptidase S41 [Coxiella sp. RIFCSPHIGHO2_12_FULL_42_15]|nr:MAG: peptidase S41 [Coxiella sp. RIFCSPHIGHO2_12_FULL_42_15]
MLKIFKLSLASLVFVAASTGYSAEPTQFVTLPQALAPNQVVSDLPSNQRLPRDDIVRFVTAIAVIHRYYIKQTANNTLFNNAIRGMVDSLDPHSSYLDPNALKELKTAVSGRFVGIGIELTIKDGLLKVISPLNDSPAEKAGIKPEDLIIKVNGTLIRDINLDEAVKRIKGKKGTTVQLTILRKGTEQPLVLNVVRDEIKLVSVKSKLVEGHYGYAQITFFQGPVEQQLRDAIEKIKAESKDQLYGLVLDLRNNPGGLLDVSTAVADDFLDSTQMNNKYNGYLVYTKGRIPGSDMHVQATPGDLIKGIPMVVLINGGSASASEIVAGALQDYKRAIIMGTRSFGKGSVQTVLPIGDDSAIKLTTALYYTPAGQVIQAHGIIPDVTIPQLSVKDLDANNFIVDEADFENHLITNKEEKEDLSTKMSLRKELLKSQLALAESDYQLYEAVMMLKGLNSIKHYGYERKQKTSAVAISQ